MGHHRIGTYVRLKPSARPSPALHVDATNSSIRVDLRHATGGPPRSHGDQMVFHYDGVLQNASQEACFHDCALKIVENVLCGYNGTILAYGQSGSGKTFTMSGDLKNSSHKGIIPRAIHRIFAEKQSRPDSETSIHVSYLEIYNEVIYDLLTERKGSSRIINIMEDNSFLEMKGLSQFPCETEEDAMKYFLYGERHRSVNPNTMNKNSNRSHCMFTIYVERHTKARDYPERTAAKLNLVDLAGCERIKGMDAVRPCEKEIFSINKSLTFLEQAVAELRKGQGHVSFRQSRLTMLLKDALGGNSRTVLIVCALQEHDYMDEVISTLRFAQRVKDLKTSAVINKVVDSVEVEREKYERKIAELKRELAFHDALNGRRGVSHDDITEERRAELKSKVEAFLSEKTSVDCIPIESLAQIKETFYLFKEAQSQLHAQMAKLCKENSVSKVEENQLKLIDDKDGVGELEAQGYYVGVAPLDSKPAKLDTNIATKVARMPDSSLLTNKAKHSHTGDREQRNMAFHEFKHTTAEGTQHSEFLRERKMEMKEKKKLLRNLCKSMKDVAREIHEINCLLIEDTNGVTSCEEIEVNEGVTEQDQLRERLKNAKNNYQNCLLELTLLKTEIQSLKKELEAQALVEVRVFTNLGEVLEYAWIFSERKACYLLQELGGENNKRRNQPSLVDDDESSTTCAIITTIARNPTVK